MAVTDARVKFLRGLKASLPQTLTDGNVYIATDERAMYVDYMPAGTGATLTRIRIGDIIEYSTWTEIENLPTGSLSTSALYYANTGNILAKWNGTTWVQINGQNLANIIKSMAYDVTVANNNTATIYLKVTKPDSTIAYTNLKYKLASADASVLRMTSATDANGITTVTMRAKDLVSNTEAAVATTAYADNYANLSIYNYETGTDASGSTVSAPALSSLTAKSIIKFEGVDATHVKADATTGTISIDTKINVTHAFGSDGKLTITTKDMVTNTNINTSAVTPTIAYGNTNSTAVFANGTATLSVYTQAETDTLIQNALKGADAMTFKGGLGNTTTDGAIVAALPLTASTVKIGDTYKVVTADTYTISTAASNNQQDAIIGDMFIATSTDGTEDGDGYIVPSKIRWVYIPSGDDISNYKLVYADSSKSFYLNKNGVKDGLSMKIDTTDLTASSTGSGTNQVVTIAHKIYNATTTADNTTNANIGGANNSDVFGTGTFTAVTGVDVSNGHVTGIKTGTFSVQLKAITSVALTGTLKNGTTTVNPSATATAGRLEVKHTLTDGAGTPWAATMNLTSESLTFTKASANADVGIDLFWESF